MECYKCYGTGWIPGFSHVCGGKCFLCNGAGVIPDVKKKNVGYSRMFLREFAQQCGFCDSLEDLTKKGYRLIKWLSHEDHPTAKKGLFTNDVEMIICQPICRSSIWDRIPVDKFPEFQQHYKKAYKRDLL